jgi:hypothetical protein
MEPRVNASALNSSAVPVNHYTEVLERSSEMPVGAFPRAPGIRSLTSQRESSRLLGVSFKAHAFLSIPKAFSGARKKPT